jgi:hypothetical protein
MRKASPSQLDGSGSMAAWDNDRCSRTAGHGLKPDSQPVELGCLNWSFTEAIIALIAIHGRSSAAVHRPFTMNFRRRESWYRTDREKYLASHAF